MFVNRRPIFDKTINHAITQAYQTLIMDKEFPPLALFITTPPEFVDVNVHPHKREIRFRESSVVHDVLVAMIRQALAGTAGKLAQGNSVFPQGSAASASVVRCVVVFSRLSPAIWRRTCG